MFRITHLCFIQQHHITARQRPPSELGTRQDKVFQIHVEDKGHGGVATVETGIVEGLVNNMKESQIDDDCDCDSK